MHGALRQPGLVSRRRFTKSSSEVEDAVQEIFIELWSKAGRFDESRSGETTFVAMVARRRSGHRGRPVPTRPGNSGKKLDRESQTAATADHTTGGLRGSFPPVDRLLDLPLGTVKTHLRRGLLQIRDDERELDTLQIRHPEIDDDTMDLAVAAMLLLAIRARIA